MNKDSIYWLDNVYYVKGVGIVISQQLKMEKLELMIKCY